MFDNRPMRSDEPRAKRRDHLTVAQRSLAMAKVHRRDTSAELRLRRALWREGVRGWRCDLKGLPGRPDIAFTRVKVAVFVDGLLWHGHPKRYPANLDAAWRAKIARNVERDRAVDQGLRELGWFVERFWEEDIRRNLAEVVERLRGTLARRRSDGSPL